MFDLELENMFDYLSSQMDSQILQLKETMELFKWSTPINHSSRDYGQPSMDGDIILYTRIQPFDT